MDISIYSEKPNRTVPNGLTCSIKLNLKITVKGYCCLNQNIGDIKNYWVFRGLTDRCLACAYKLTFDKSYLDRRFINSGLVN